MGDDGRVQIGGVKVKARQAVEIIMKCQTCVRARLRHLTWPINLGLIGLCHNKTLALSERDTDTDTDTRHLILMCIRF